jgi:hypothetical protein
VARRNDSTGGNPKGDKTKLLSVLLQRKGMGRQGGLFLFQPSNDTLKSRTISDIRKFARNEFSFEIQTYIFTALQT